MVLHRDESEAAASKTNTVSDGTPAPPSLASPAVVPSSEPLHSKSKQDVPDNTDSSASVALVSDLTEFPSLSSAASQSSAQVLPAKATPVPSASAGEREPTAVSEQEARPTSPSQQPSPREKPPTPPAVEIPAAEPPQRVPEKAPEESAPTSLPSKSSGGRYVPPAMRRAAASGSGSSSDLASAKGKAGEEEEEKEKEKEEKEKESKSSGGGGGGGAGGSSYRPPHMRNKDRGEPASGASGAKEALKEPTSPLKERTGADIMREKFGNKGRENKREADAPMLPDIGNQEDFPTLYIFAA